MWCMWNSRDMQLSFMNLHNNLVTYMHIVIVIIMIIIQLCHYIVMLSRHSLLQFQNPASRSSLPIVSLVS